MSAYLMISLNTQAFLALNLPVLDNSEVIQKSINFSSHPLTVATGNSEGFAQSLSERATQQSKAIAAALGQIQAMTKSVQAVAINTEEVETTFQQVLKTVATGDVAMDRIVAGIMDIRQTVAEIAQETVQESEASQKITQTIRDLSTQYQKPVSLEMKGTDILVDKGILEKLHHPLLHLIRNAFDLFK